MSNDYSFVRGFSPVRRLTERGGKFVRSCYNCEHYYQAPGDDCEVCQNEKVLDYDMVVTENNISCRFWELSFRKIDAKTLFKKKGKK